MPSSEPGFLAVPDSRAGVSPSLIGSQVPTAGCSALPGQWPVLTLWETRLPSSRRLTARQHSGQIPIVSMLTSREFPVHAAREQRSSPGRPEARLRPRGPARGRCRPSPSLPASRSLTGTGRCTQAGRRAGPGRCDRGRARPGRQAGRDQHPLVSPPLTASPGKPQDPVSPQARRSGATGMLADGLQPETIASWAPRV
jgi:hypothetical protein